MPDLDAIVSAFEPNQTAPVFLSASQTTLGVEFVWRTIVLRVTQSFASYVNIHLEQDKQIPNDDAKFSVTSYLYPAPGEASNELQHFHLKTFRAMPPYLSFIHDTAQTFYQAVHNDPSLTLNFCQNFFFSKSVFKNVKFEFGAQPKSDAVFVLCHDKLNSQSKVHFSYTRPRVDHSYFLLPFEFVYIKDCTQRQFNLLFRSPTHTAFLLVFRRFEGGTFTMTTTPCTCMCLRCISGKHYMCYTKCDDED